MVDVFVFVHFYNDFLICSFIVVYTERGEKVRLISARLASAAGGYIMTTAVEYVKGQKLTKEQIMEIEEAKKKPIVYDEDSPELTSAMEKAFALAAKNRNRYKRIG